MAIGAMVTSTDRERAIDEYDFSFVHEKLESEANLVGECLDKIELEFKKFLKLVLREDGPLAVIDKRVDDFWHTLILFTPQYEEFCRSIMGFFVHHQPRTSRTPVPEYAIANFVRAYRHHFGELDPFWMERVDPQLRALMAAETIPSAIEFDWSGWTGRNFHP